MQVISDPQQMQQVALAEKRAGRRVVYHPDCRVAHVLTAEKLSRRYLRRRAQDRPFDVMGEAALLRKFWGRR